MNDAILLYYAWNVVHYWSVSILCTNIDFNLLLCTTEQDIDMVDDVPFLIKNTKIGSLPNPNSKIGMYSF